MAHQMSEGTDADETLKAAFRCFDADSSGLISKDEIRDVMREMGEFHMNEADFDAVLASMDLDGDGEISHEEFATFLTREMREHGYRLA